MKLKAISLAASICLAAGCATSQEGSDSTASPAEYRKKIERFADMAAQGKTDSMINEVSTLTLEQNSKDRLKEYFQHKIVPFFANYKTLSDDGKANRVADNRGQVYMQHYEFIESKDGQKQPFVITLFDDKGEVYVTSIEVGKCLPGYHSQCP